MAATEQQVKIINLYVSLFNRAPDAEGLGFWVQALQDGASLDTITQNFLATPEALANYPTTQSAQQFIATFYQSVFGRAPDINGLQFWTDALNAAGGADSDVAKASVFSQINAIVSTPLDTKPADLSDAEYAETVSDRATFANKLAVGTYFAIDNQGTDVALAKLAFSSVNAAASSVAAAKEIIDAPATGGSSGVALPAALAPTLIGTDNDDVFDLTHSTVSPSDIIDGMGGNDTLNYIDDSTTGVPFPATVRNVETINIRNINTAPISAEQVFFYGLRDLTDGQTLSIAGITITSNGVATAAQITDAILSGNSVGNAVYSGALDGYTVSKVGGRIAFLSSVTGNVPDLIATGSGARLTILQTSQGENGLPHTIDTSRFVGATSFNSDRSTIAVAFDGLASGQIIGSTGDGVLNTQDVSGTYANNVTKATVNLLKVKGGIVTLNGDGLTSAVVNSTGVLDSIFGITLTPGTDALHINAATEFQAGGIYGQNLKTITINGAASSVGLGLSELHTLTSIDASGLTEGGIVAHMRVGNLNILGGSGKDVIKFAANSYITGVIDAGGGDQDTIEFLDRSSTSLGTAVFRNFEIAQFRTSQGSLENYDVSSLSGISDYRVANSSIKLSNLVAGASVTVNGNAQRSNGLTLNFADTSSDSDYADVTLNNAESVGVGVSLPSLRIPGVETLRLHSLSTNDSANSAINSVVNASENTKLSRVVIDGDTAIVFETGPLWSSGILTVDASAATGALDLRGIQAASSLRIDGGSAADKIQVGLFGSTIYGGAGGDAIILPAPGSLSVTDRLVYKNSSDSILDVEKEAGVAGAKMDAITGFHSGIDNINLTALITKTDGTSSYFGKNFASVTELVAAEGSSTFYTEGVETRVAVAARIGADTYLVVDTNKDGVFNAEGDLVVKLVGATLQESDLIFGSAP